MGTVRKAKRGNELQSEIGSRGKVFARSQEGCSPKGAVWISGAAFIHTIGVLFVRRRRVCSVPVELFLDSGLSVAAA